MDKPWFDVKLPINPGLVAVVGNKGSGKSALVDVLALLGFAECRDYSFLSSSRFRKRPPNFASDYQAKISWLCGRETSLRLSEDFSENSTPLVRYLPQKHLQLLCEELPEKGDTRFESELKRIIFGNLREEDRQNKATFEELIQARTSEQERMVEKYRLELRELNESIVSLKAPSSVLNSLEQKLLAKREEIERHDAQRPVVQDPDGDRALDPTTIAAQQLIAKLEGELWQLEERISKATEALALLRVGGTKLKSAIARVKEAEASAHRLIGELVIELDGIVAAEEVRSALSVEARTSVLEAALGQLRERYSQAAALLDANNAESLPSQRLAISEQMILAHRGLGAVQLRIQAQRASLQAWSKVRGDLVGKANESGSSQWIEGQIERVQSAGAACFTS